MSSPCCGCTHGPATSSTSPDATHTNRPGGTVRTLATLARSSMPTTWIGAKHPKVWIDLARISIAPCSIPRRPRRRTRLDVARTTGWIRRSPTVIHTLRYGACAGTLAPLWQRQNDASCAPAARRRTTAASPTLAAAEPRLQPFRRSCGPMRAFYRVGTGVFKVPAGSQSPSWLRRSSPATGSVEAT